MPEIARQTAMAAFAAAGMREGIDFSLQVAPRSEPSEMVIL